MLTRQRTTKAILTTLLGFISCFVQAYTSGNYPRLAQMKTPNQQITISQGNHPITYAVENSMAIPLLDQSALTADWQYIIPPSQFKNDYLYRRLNSNALVQAISPVIRDVVCAEYRFRHRHASSNHCSKSVKQHNGRVEGMPFVSGSFTENSAINDYNDRKNRVSYEAYLPSSKQFALNTLEGSIHELGTFFGRFASNRSLVITMRIKIYTIDRDGFRIAPLNRTPLLLWIVLPSAQKLSQQNSQNHAANYALENAQLLVLGKHRAW